MRPVRTPSWIELATWSRHKYLGGSYATTTTEKHQHLVYCAENYAFSLGAGCHDELAEERFAQLEEARMDYMTSVTTSRAEGNPSPVHESRFFGTITIGRPGKPTMKMPGAYLVLPVVLGALGFGLSLVYLANHLLELAP